VCAFFIISPFLALEMETVSAREGGKNSKEENQIKKIKGDLFGILSLLSHTFRIISPTMYK